MKNGRKPPLRFTHIRLENWRNFLELETDVAQRFVLVGPNASGKSNLLDAFRFLGDLTKVGGGFRAAVGKSWRGDRLHCLAGKRHTHIGIHVCVGTDKKPNRWEYELRFSFDRYASPNIKTEQIRKDGKTLKTRPDADDERDKFRLGQTSLEQTSVNKTFRDLASFFASIRYTHLIPQVLRRQVSAYTSEDPFGGNLLRQIKDMNPEERSARLTIVEEALRAAIPSWKTLEFWLDNAEKQPHLRAEFSHLPDAYFLEDQLSDGSLRLIGLVWDLLDAPGPLLFEEPELSLHSELVRLLPQILARLQNRTGRQVIFSTHSAELLRDTGIGLDEVLLLQPKGEATAARLAKDFDEIRVLLESGISMDEAVLPHTASARLPPLSVMESSDG